MHTRKLLLGLLALAGQALAADPNLDASGGLVVPACGFFGPAQELVSNPGVLRTFAHGGPGADVPHSMETDVQGNVYVTGYYSGVADFDPGPGQTRAESGGGRDLFLVKLDPQGNLAWLRELGDPDAVTPPDEALFEEGMDLNVDAAGNVFVTGIFNGTIDFDPADGPDATDTFTSQGGAADMLVASYGADGAYRWGRTFGGAGRDGGHALHLAPDGDVLLGGFFTGSVSFGADTLTSSGNWDAFVARFGPHGTPRWARGFGGPELDQVRPGAMSTDRDGNILLTGSVGRGATVGASRLAANGAGDVFVAKFTAQGAPTWAFAVGGSGLDGGHRIEADGSGNVYVVGWFRGTTNFDPAGRAAPLTARAALAASDVFVAQYTPNGAFTRAAAYGGAVTAASD